MFPLTPRLREILEEQIARTEALQKVRPDYSMAVSSEGKSDQVFPPVMADGL
jgi:hypothetical protein